MILANIAYKNHRVPRPMSLGDRVPVHFFFYVGLCRRLLFNIWVRWLKERLLLLGGLAEAAHRNTLAMFVSRMGLSLRGFFSPILTSLLRIAILGLISLVESILRTLVTAFIRMGDVDPFES
ncbi:hypothetical protein [Crucivirus-392]|nr:hypothetical protein [Crucivirus-392]